MKGRSIQDILHLVRQILEGIEDDTETALINLDQSKASDRVDHRFLATAPVTAGFESGFRKCISMVYHNPQGGGAGERKAFKGFRDRVIGSLFSISSFWSLCAESP